MKMERDILPSGALYIGGDWREGRGAEITSVFPADGTVTRVLRGASTEDGEEAIARARAAQPAWGALKPFERARVLYRIADGIEARLKAIGHRPDHVEGYVTANWVLIDCFDFVVHVFTPEPRDFYALERLWGNAVRVDV